MTDLAGKEVILTGATGFIGRYVADELIAAGADVFAVVRPDSPHDDELTEKEGLRVLRCDIKDIPKTIRDTVKETGGAMPPFAFLHFAWGGVNRGEIDTDEVQQKNIDLSMAALKAAEELGCQVFMDAGSRVEYGITRDGVMEEHMPCSPVNAYGRAKLRFFEQAAALAKEWGMTYYHLRFFSVYGVGDHPWSVISTLTRDLPRGKTVNLSACEHRWNFMHVRDAAAAVITLLRHSDAFKGQVNTVNVAGSDTRVLKDFVEEIYQLCEESIKGNKSAEYSKDCIGINDSGSIDDSAKVIGTLEFGTFRQAKEGALSICPVTKELDRLCEGAWKEKVSFAEGTGELLRWNAARNSEIQITGGIG